jgi:hypothetical protein
MLSKNCQNSFGSLQKSGIGGDDYGLLGGLFMPASTLIIEQSAAAGEAIVAPT